MNFYEVRLKYPLQSFISNYVIFLLCVVCSDIIIQQTIVPGCLKIYIENP